jgi:Fibronectin type III-like domain
VPQVYLTDAAGEKRLRLLGFERVELAPGASTSVTILKAAWRPFVPTLGVRALRSQAVTSTIAARQSRS